MNILNSNLYDNVEYHFNCAVQILTNTITGEQSIGWVNMNSPIAKEWISDVENEIRDSDEIIEEITEVTDECIDEDDEEENNKENEDNV